MSPIKLNDHWWSSTFINASTFTVIRKVSVAQSRKFVLESELRGEIQLALHGEFRMSSQRCFCSRTKDKGQIMTRAIIVCVAVVALATTGCNNLPKKGGGGLFGNSCGAGGCTDGGCTDSCSDGSCGNGNCGPMGKLGGMLNPKMQTPLRDNGICGNKHLYGQHFTQPGPPTGHVAYPYYTNRGPRDFLMARPPSIGY